MLKTLLMTGAAGTVGKALRPMLTEIAETVILSDLEEIDGLAPHERFVACDLGDRDAVWKLIEGVDGILHLGGISVEKPFDLILNANILGLYNLYEGARRNGMPRIIFASSNHTIGYYPREERIDTRVPMRPDSFYGVSKCFGENLATMYFYKFGQETLSVRIGACFEAPGDPSMLATWLSARDLLSLCKRGFEAARVAHTVIYGVSDNEEMWWDNSAATFLGWQPQDSADPWRAEVLEAAAKADPRDPATLYQGGTFAAAGHPEDELNA